MAEIYLTGTQRAGRKKARLSHYRSTLTGLEAALHLVDHIDSALATHQTVIAMAGTQ
jgi:hypothetical protein